MGESKGRRLLRAFSDVPNEPESSEDDNKDKDKGKGKKGNDKKQPPAK